MTLSPLILLLLGVLAYRTYKGKGPLAEMLRGLTGAAPDAASAPPEGYPQGWDVCATGTADGRSADGASHGAARRRHAWSIRRQHGCVRGRHGGRIDRKRAQ